MIERTLVRAVTKYMDYIQLSNCVFFFRANHPAG